MSGKAYLLSLEWRDADGYETSDEIRFVQRLAATDFMKFRAYAETLHLRARWGRIHRGTIIKRVDQLLRVSQPHASVLS